MIKDGNDGEGIWLFSDSYGNYKNTYYVKGKDTQDGFGYFKFEPSNNSSNFTVDYKTIGYYYLSEEEQNQLVSDNIISEDTDKIDIGCRVKFSCKDLNRDCDYNPIFMTVSKNFYNGLWYSHMTVDANYEFFISETYNSKNKKYTSIKLDNTCFTANSLNTQEAVAYLTDKNAPGYCLDAEINKFFQKEVEGDITYFRGSMGSSAKTIPGTDKLYSRGVLIWEPRLSWHQYSFDDWRGSSNLNRSSISYKLKKNSKNHVFRFKAYQEEKNSLAWMCPSCAPLGMKTIKPVKKFKKKNESNYIKNVKGKVTSDFYVNNGDEIEFKITQKLHNVGEDIISDVHYNQLKLIDKLSDQLQYTESTLSIGGSTISRNNYSINRKNNTVTITFKKDYLDNLDLAGQTITWIISAKVNAKNSNIITNKSTTVFNDSTCDSNEIILNILPQFNTGMVKSSNPTQITDTEQKVNYSMRFTDNVLYYKGNAIVTIVDTLPYKLDTTKKNDLNGGTYNDANRTITWTQKVSNIDSFNNSNNRIDIRKNISVFFKGIDTKATSMTNYVTGTIKTDTPPRTSSANANAITTFNFKIDVKAKKNWDDQGRDRSKRPEPLTFVLYQNGTPTNKTYKLSPKTKDNEEYTFKNLPKYDGNGKKINYEVREISKQSGNNYYRLQDMRGNVVENRSDLRYYIDSTTTEADPNDTGGKTKTYIIKNTYTSVNIMGNVWLDSGIDGRKANGEIGFKGVSAQLLFKHGGTGEYEYYGYNVRTDANGNYSFNDLPWNGTYKVRFIYNGQVYEATYYKDVLSGGYSNAKEYNEERDTFNKKFENINAYPNNYGNGKRAFGINEKIKNVSTNDFIYNTNGNPYVFANDILSEFNNMETNYSVYNDSFYNGLKTKLQNKGIDATTANSLVDYIRDCMTYADSRNYSTNDLGALKPGSNNTISSVDFGLSERARGNLSIRNDIYKITYTINGKQFDEYEGYNGKPSNIFSVEDRAKNEYYNGVKVYNKPIYKSDYIYDGKDVAEGGENRNLEIYVTYRIVITNSGQVSATVRSLDNYYDNKNYERFNLTKGLKICRDNIKLGSFTDEDTNEMLKDYRKLKLTTNNPVLLHPGESTNVDLTFKVKTENRRVKISESKKNIVEINSYSTYYMPEDSGLIPDYLQNNNGRVNKRITGKTVAGLVDIDSDPGSLRETDLTAEGDLIYSEQKGGSIYQRIENDTDKSSNLNITLSDESRAIGGFVFEDTRNVKNDKLKTSLGNGKYDNNETKINGVTVQLVELVREIDPVTKLQKDNYIGEYVWCEWKYKNLVEDPTKLEDEKKYYTGKGNSCVILSGEGELAVPEIQLGNNEEECRGKYQFNSFIPGDYYVRFTYGDTNKTVLTTDESAIAKAQSIGQLDSNNNPLAVNSVVNDKGLNAKSYNGQDYKSTIYQPSVNQAEIGSYNGITGYLDSQNQNFLNSIDDYMAYNADKNGYIKNNTRKMYLYKNSVNDSNAKDLFGDRERIQDLYGEKKHSDLYENKMTGINNAIGEMLRSYEMLATDEKGNLANTQKAMLDELKRNTQMRAHSGVMDIGVVHNNANTNQAILGLTERAESQITLMKEVSSVSVVLSNGEILFDTNKSVNNLYFGKHTGHTLKYDAYRINPNSVEINSEDANKQPELIQAYMDDELMQGSTLSTRYKIMAKNVGEVDFNDMEYYYTGIEKDPEKNIAKTCVNRVVDYISNSVVFDIDKQKESDSWSIAKANDLVNGGYVTGRYKPIMDKYNTILVSEGLNKELIPEQYRSQDSFASVELVLDTTLSNVLSKDSLVYNNMAEIIQATNQQGRRCALSIPGNEEMPDQEVISNAKPGMSVLDRKVPKEIDVDSAQKIVFMPPTGEENYTWLIIMSVIAAGIIAGGVLVIKKIILKH